MVDLAIVGGHVLTMDADRRELSPGAVLVEAGAIVAVGPPAIAGQVEAARTIDATGCLVLPGMINTHTHAAMTLFRGLGDDEPDRLRRFIWPLESRVVDSDSVHDGALLGCLEMVLGGVTCFADMYFFEEEVAAAAAAIGLRAVVGQTVIGHAAPDAATPAEALERAGALLADWRGHDLVIPALAPHAPDTLPAAVLKAVRDLSAAENAPVLIHLCETEAELATIRERSGLTPVGYLDSLGLLGPRLLGAHCIHVDEADIALLAASGTGVAHNMVANIKAAKGVAPVPAMLAAGVAVGLGTDGPMSGNTLDVIGQLGYVAKLHKLTAGDRTAMPAREVVAMATIGGARALGLDDRIGSIEPGKRADIVLIDATGAHMTPLYDPYAALVYAANAADVRTVTVDGRIVVEDRRLLTADTDAIKAAANDRRERILAALPG
ncbi:MAG: amidohydrolase [Inquilinus sp.]|nr:amidohydrolase [Inquilinus sp.]